MHVYNVQRSNVALSLSNDFFTIISAAARSFGILEIDFQGMGNASGANECGIYRVATAGVTGGGAITPAPVSPTSPAFTGTVNTTWSTQPVVGTLVHPIPINSNGQRYFWRCNPNLNNAIWSPGGANAAGSLSVGRSLTGTSNVSGRVQVAEIG
jgi:hypothetical protein